MTEFLRAWARIDQEALRHNVSAIRSLVGQRCITAVVKANAYGHHLDVVVPGIVDRVDGFAVATIEEGITVRGLAPLHPIMVLSEFNAPSQLATFRAHQLQPVLHHAGQVEWVCGSTPLSQGVWLKVDSGMRRLGVAPEQARSLMDSLTRSGHPVSLMSHLASAEDPASGQTQRQLDCLGHVRDELGGPTTSLANSAGVIASEDSHLDHVRPGLLLFGVSPFETPGELAPRIDMMDLKPVMTLEARLIAVKSVAPGDQIGYGATLTIDRPGRIGIVGFGYADGYPRSVRSKGAAWFDGQRVPLAGRVSMDMLTVDLSQCDNPQPGQVVQLWGPDLPVTEVAKWANTIPYELLCRVAPRVPRIAGTGTA